MTVVRCLVHLLSLAGLLSAGALGLSLYGGSPSLSVAPVQEVLHLLLICLILLAVLSFLWMVFKRAAFLAICCIALAPMAYEELGRGGRDRLVELRRGACQVGAAMESRGLGLPYADAWICDGGDRPRP